MKELTKGEQFVVNWQYRKTSGFEKYLTAAIVVADNINLDLLRKAYPDEVGAYHSYIGEDGWWDKVKKKAGYS